MAAKRRAERTRQSSKLRQLFWLMLLAAAFAPAWADDAADKAAKPAAEDKNAGAPDAAQATEGYLIRVDLPLTGDADTRVRAAVTKIISSLHRGAARPILIIELSAGQIEDGRGSDFHRAMPLAKYLASPDLAGVKTVAYIPSTVKGHAVLVAMACEEIVMAPGAELGEAGIDESIIDADVRSGYTQIANARRTIPPAVALAMLDRPVKALKVSTEVGTQYVLEDGLDELKKSRVVQAVEPLKPQPFIFDGRRGRELGFVSYLADDRNDLARSLKLPPEAVRDNPALAGGWRPVQVDLKRVILAKDVSIVQRKIEDQIRENEANLVVIRIDSDGGSYGDSIQLANYLSGLKPNEVRTVAYIPRNARADAALIALACDQIVMAPDAMLGGEGMGTLRPDQIPDVVRTVQEAVKHDKARSWSIPVAMVDPKLKVYRYRQPASGLPAYFSEQELAEQHDPGSWRQGELVTPPGGTLRLSGRKAEEMGVAWKLVDNFEQFKQIYGLEKNPEMVEPGWVDYLVDALTTEGARMFLLVIGFVGLYLEIHAPGMGIGAFIALIAFLLYFWAQHLKGTAQALEVILFLTGMLCLALEIFVIPGFGIFGFGGGLLVIASLVLASQTFIIPANEYQLEQLRDSMLVLGGATVGCIAMAATLRRFLPRAPMLNRMMLEPPSAEEQHSISQRESLADLDHLLGQQGTATTRLMPSGKARFGEQLVDVVASGEAIDRGASVVVTEVSGSRVIVRAAT